MTPNVLPNRFSRGTIKSHAILSVTKQRDIWLVVFSIKIIYIVDQIYKIKHLDGKFTTDKQFSPTNVTRQKNPVDSLSTGVYFMHHIISYKQIRTIMDTCYPILFQIMVYLNILHLAGS